MKIVLSIFLFFAIAAALVWPVISDTQRRMSWKEEQERIIKIHDLVMQPDACKTPGKYKFKK